MINNQEIKEYIDQLDTNDTNQIQETIISLPEPCYRAQQPREQPKEEEWEWVEVSLPKKRWNLRVVGILVASLLVAVLLGVFALVR
jgi:hypothetical protein